MIFFADHELNSPAELSAAAPRRVQCGRSGTFNAKSGGAITLKPEDLASLAETFDSDEEHLLKLGHRAVDTDTPDYGRVVGLSYDRASDRLLADILPSPVTVRKNREEGFRRVSMEIERLARGGFRFLHLALLGAHPPAISGLEAVALASGHAFVRSSAGRTLTAADLDAMEARVKKMALAAAQDRIQFFVAENYDRIPAEMLDAGFEEAMPQLLAYDLARPMVELLLGAIEDLPRVDMGSLNSGIRFQKSTLFERAQVYLAAQRAAGRTIAFADALEDVGAQMELERPGNP